MRKRYADRRRKTLSLSYCKMRNVYIVRIKAVSGASMQPATFHIESHLNTKKEYCVGPETRNAHSRGYCR
jgi:hypothetical protein